MKTKIKKIIIVTVCIIAFIALTLFCLVGCLLRNMQIGRRNATAQLISDHMSEHLTDESILPKDVLKQKEFYLFFKETGEGTYIKPCELFPDGKQTKEILSHNSNNYAIHFKEGAVVEVWCTYSNDELHESDLRPYDYKEQKKQFGHIYSDHPFDIIGYWSSAAE